MAGLYVFRDAAVRGKLMTEGRAELWELKFGLASAEQVTRGVWRRGGGSRGWVCNGGRSGQRGGEEMSVLCQEVPKLHWFCEGKGEVAPRGARSAW